MKIKLKDIEIQKLIKIKKKFFSIIFIKLVIQKFLRKKEDLVKAFQRKFRQKLINGKIDKECFLISKNLSK